MDVFIGIVILCIDSYLLYIHKDVAVILLLNLIFLYFDYSIIFGSYVLNGLTPPNSLHNTIHGDMYSLGIRLMLIFGVIRLFFQKRKYKFLFRLPQQNSALFYSTIVALIYVFITQVNRKVTDTYTVHISPLFEYSYLLFFLGGLYSGKSKFKRSILLFFASLFVIQDMYLGGRATSLQIVVVLAVLFFEKYIKTSNLLKVAIPALILLNFVGTYRNSYSVEIGVSDIFSRMLAQSFVLDTATYSCLAGMTQLYASFFLTQSFKLQSFIAFCLSILVGSSGMVGDFDISLSLVTQIANSHHWNAGGGLMPTIYYFWFGIWGTIVLTILTFWLLNYVIAKGEKNIFVTYILVLIIASSPRWILYSPLAFFRGPFIIFPILYSIYYIVDKTMSSKL